MKEFLSTLLQAVLIAAVPVIAAYTGKGITALAGYVSAKTANDLAQKYLEDAANAVATAVSQTSQTYVDGLKEHGNFTKENQKVALSLSVDQARNLLTADARDFLEKAYGNLNSFLVSKIEAEVRRQKLGEAVFSVPLEAVEAEKESPNVASVAAATAAATAAAVVQSAVQQVTQTQGVDCTVEATAETTVEITADTAGGADGLVEGGEAPAV